MENIVYKEVKDKDGRVLGKAKCKGNYVWCNKCKDWQFSYFLAKTGNPPRACGYCKDKTYWYNN